MKENLGRMARAWVPAFALVLLAGCDMAKFYFEQTEGISPATLLPLYFQEKQYVQDRSLEAQVKGALASEPALSGADLGVEVYKSKVTLTGRASAGQARRAVQVAQEVFGVDSVESRLQ